MGVIGGAPGGPVFSTAPASGAVVPPRSAGVRRPGRPPGGSLAAPRLHLNAVEVSGKGHCARQRCRGTVVPPRSAGATPRAPSRGGRLRRRECGVVGRTAGSLHGRLLPRTDVVAVVVPLMDAMRMAMAVVPTPVRPPGPRREGGGGPGAGGRAGPGGPSLAAGQGLQRGALRLRRPGRRGLRAQRRLGGRHARVARGRAPPASQASTSYSTWYLVRFTTLLVQVLCRFTRAGRRSFRLRFGEGAVRDAMDPTGPSLPLPPPQAGRPRPSQGGPVYLVPRPVYDLLV